MTIYIPSNKDISISVDYDGETEASPEECLKASRELFRLYSENSTANVVRSFAVCPKCQEICTYNDGSQSIPLSRCIILKKTDDKTIVAPVQWIHILQEHQESIDPRVLQFFAKDE